MTDYRDRKRTILRLMDELILELEPYQSNPTIRQIWLETHWLKQKLKDDRLALPTWQLMIFQQPEDLRKHERAAAKANRLADVLLRYASDDRESK